MTTTTPTISTTSLPLQRWCADECARGNCPADSCQCEVVQLCVTPQPTTPAARVCKALSLWKGIAAFDGWCTEECNKGSCPPETCQCNDAQLQPLSTTTATRTKPSTAVCTSNGVVGGDYWNGWCQQNCDRNYCPVDYCLCT